MALLSVDHHPPETLTARRSSPEQAVDLIVSGLLGKREASNRGIVRFHDR